ncbi:hypothetical protein PR048_013392 [Dryococelus australis]|uniref:DDE-1 domain-containing protein n=1 Tax=Dryococelus australis TaxID=614101 RepID=A0ABQ9HS12_9NEOP|nr:hypothetical protein PR048_013392 [Dryococelus australis]
MLQGLSFLQCSYSKESDMPTAADIRMTPKVSMTVDTFVKFLKHFNRFNPGGKCLLIFYGVKSHLDYTICDVAEENDILLYCLPSNTMHELQPLDKCCFRSFEIYWDQHALLYFNVHKDEHDISKLNFGDSMSQGNMKSGFKTTGIYPFNPLIIPDEAFARSAATELHPPEPATNEQDIDEQMPPESTFSYPTPGTSDSAQLPLSRHTPVTVTSKFHKCPRTPVTSSIDSNVDDDIMT